MKDLIRCTECTGCYCTQGLMFRMIHESTPPSIKLTVVPIAFCSKLWEHWSRDSQTDMPLSQAQPHPEQE